MRCRDYCLLSLPEPHRLAVERREGLKLEHPAGKYHKMTFGPHRYLIECHGSAHVGLIEDISNVVQFSIQSCTPETSNLLMATISS